MLPTDSDYQKMGMTRAEVILPPTPSMILAGSRAFMQCSLSNAPAGQLLETLFTAMALEGMAEKARIDAIWDREPALLAKPLTDRRASSRQKWQEMTDKGGQEDLTWSFGTTEEEGKVVENGSGATAGQSDAANAPALPQNPCICGMPPHLQKEKWAHHESCPASKAGVSAGQGPSHPALEGNLPLSSSPTWNPVFTTEQTASIAKNCMAHNALLRRLKEREDARECSASKAGASMPSNPPEVQFCTPTAQRNPVARLTDRIYQLARQKLTYKRGAP